MGPGVDVHAGLGLRGRAGAGLALDHGRLAEERRGLGGRGELRGELTEGQVLAALADQAEGGDVPERGGAAVAEHDLVALGQVEQAGDAVADPADQVLHRRLAVRGAEQGGAGGGEGLERLDPDLGRAGAESAVGGLESVRDGDRVGHDRYLVGVE